MSRTLRRFSRRPATGRVVRDGHWQHASPSCRNHGACAWCRGNRLHAAARRAPLVELP